MMKLTTAGGVSLAALILIGWYIRVRRVRAARRALRGAVVLITGASSGLGEACAHAFYRAGCRVILCARRLEQLQRVAQDLKLLSLSTPTHEPKLLLIDISKLSEIPAALETAVGYHGYVDVVVNNAGLSYRGNVLDTSVEVDQSVMNVNYFGQVAVVKALLPSMIKRRSGSIVAISSVQGKLSIPQRSAYGASKHALQSFCDCLRAEISHQNIAVTVVSPAYIKTNLSLNALTGDGSHYGVMDETQTKGMSPDYVADRILNAVALQQKDVVLAPLTHRLVIYLQNILPGLVCRIMSARARKNQLNSKKPL